MKIAEEGLRALRISVKTACKYGWGVVFKNETYENTKSAACYVGVNDLTRGSPLTYFYTFINYNKTKNRPSIKNATLYLHWLANHSHYQDAFITKDPLTILMEGCIFNVTAPSGLMIGAANLVRAVTEFPSTINTWCNASKHIDLHFALVFAYSVEQIENNYSFNFNQNTNHVVFKIYSDCSYGSFTKGGLANLINNHRKPEEASFKNKMQTTKVNRYWCHSGDTENLTFKGVTPVEIITDLRWTTQISRTFKFSNLAVDLPIWFKENGQ